MGIELPRWLRARCVRRGSRGNRQPLRIRAQRLEPRRLLAVGDLLHTLFSASQTPQTGQHQGFAVAATADYRVVGAPGADIDGFGGNGVVRVYDSANGLLHMLRNPTPNHGDEFGGAVAAAGNYVVVGAYEDGTGATNAGSVYVYDMSSATPATPIATLNNPSPAAFDHFGISVAIAGENVVVGASGDDTGGSGAGSAYVYDLGSAAPATPVATLNNPSPAASDNFGGAVGAAGNYIVVGAEVDATGALNHGSAYVYDMSSATPTTPVATLTNPSPAEFDRFGTSVAAAGNYVVVGANFDDTGATDAGSVYVYDLSSATPTTPVATLNNPAPAAGDNFGISVAAAGNYVVVGAYGDDTGATNTGSAYVYDLSSATPTTPVATLNNPFPATSDLFGKAVATAGNYVVVGAYLDDTGAADAGSTYVYDLNSTTPTTPVATLNEPLPASEDWFGASVAAAGNYVVLGAPQDDTGAINAGSVYVYDSSSGAPVATLNNPSPARDDEFGISVAASGNYVIVGAWEDDTGEENAGSVYIYDLSSATPTVPVVTLNNPSPGEDDEFGNAVAMAGNYVVVGASGDYTGGAGDSGSVYVYDLNSATPTTPLVTLNNPSAPADDGVFGNAVAAAGNFVVVGAYQNDPGATFAGSVYVYDLASATPTTPVATLNNPSPAELDYFGISVAAAGNYVVVGADRDDTGAADAGSAYVYDLTSGTPTTPVVTLNNPSPANFDHFGYSVAAAGNYVVVGEDSGMVYVYDLNSVTPATPVATINNPSPAIAGWFGGAVAAADNYLVVGAKQDDAQNYNQGAAYVFSTEESPPSIVNRQVFYNSSSFDGGNPAADNADDAAIAADKSALLPGNAATPANYTSYSLGLNGVMVDILNAANPANMTAADFDFHTGNDLNLGAWSTGPSPSQVAVRDMGGGVSRVTLIWPDGAIVGQWLEVTVKATPNTGLAATDLFYFGNAPGDTGDGNPAVNGTDYANVRMNPRSFVDPAPIDNQHDSNRDRRVNATDLIVVRDNGTTLETALKMIAPPAAFQAAKAGRVSAGSFSDWIEIETNSNDHAGSDGDSLQIDKMFAEWVAESEPKTVAIDRLMASLAGITAVDHRSAGDTAGETGPASEVLPTDALSLEPVEP